MTGYFSFFPKTLYSVDPVSANSEIKVITNIFQRSSFLKEVRDNLAISYEYTMKESDTAEIIADKLYGTPTRHWIVWLFNRVLDPNYSFPMSESVLQKYVEKKYNQTFEESTQTIHHYEEVITEELFTSINGYTEMLAKSTNTNEISEYIIDEKTGLRSKRQDLPAVGLQIDFGYTEKTIGNNTYRISTIIKAVSNYEYEFELNEKRRTIRLLDASYVTQLEKEFTALMNAN